VERLLKELEGKDIHELIAAGATGAGAGAGQGHLQAAIFWGGGRGGPGGVVHVTAGSSNCRVESVC
jgi:hypothetical protein